MSKSVGNTIDPFELVEKYGVDPVRYYLLREIPADDDGDFSEEKFVNRYNADLANGLGNFASRVLTLSSGLEASPNSVNARFTEKIEETRSLVQEKIQNKKFHEALANLWSLISFGDVYLNQEEPWKIEDEAKKQEILVSLLAILDTVTTELKPFLPETAEKLENALNKKGEIISPKKPEPLFPRL